MATMEALFPNVYRVTPDRATPKKYGSFFVKRRGGNLLFPCFSNHSSIASSFDEIQSMGGIAMQLLADMHFRSKHNDEVFDRFGALLWCSQPELEDTSRLVKHVEPFELERQELAPGVVAIPTPGHRPGGTCYLVTLGRRRYLFAGDEIWHSESDGWRSYCSKANRKKMTRSLESLKDETFDALLSNTTVADAECFIELDAAGRVEFLDGLISRL